MRKYLCWFLAVMMFYVIASGGCGGGSSGGSSDTPSESNSIQSNDAAPNTSSIPNVPASQDVPATPIAPNVPVSQDTTSPPIAPDTPSSTDITPETSSGFNGTWRVDSGTYYMNITGAGNYTFPYIQGSAEPSRFAIDLSKNTSDDYYTLRLTGYDIEAEHEYRHLH